MSSEQEIATLRQAIGLASTIKPSMVMNVDDPIGMMREVAEEVDGLREALAAAERERDEKEDALRKCDDWLHDALDKLGVPPNARAAGDIRDGVVARVKNALAAAEPSPATCSNCAEWFEKAQRFYDRVEEAAQTENDERVRRLEAVDRYEEQERTVARQAREITTLRAENERLGGLREPIRIIFDGPPSHESGRFVEVENTRGESIECGEWIECGGGLWELYIQDLPFAALTGKGEPAEPECDVCGGHGGSLRDSTDEGPCRKCGTPVHPATPEPAEPERPIVHDAVPVRVPPFQPTEERTEYREACARCEAGEECGGVYRIGTAYYHMNLVGPCQAGHLRMQEEPVEPCETDDPACTCSVDPATCFLKSVQPCPGHEPNETMAHAGMACVGKPAEPECSGDVFIDGVAAEEIARSTVEPCGKCGGSGMVRGCDCVATECAIPDIPCPECNAGAKKLKCGEWGHEGMPCPDCQGGD